MSWLNMFSILPVGVNEKKDCGALGLKLAVESQPLFRNYTSPNLIIVFNSM